MSDDAKALLFCVVVLGGSTLLMMVMPRIFGRRK